MLIAGSPVRGSGTPIHAFNPSTGQHLEPAYPYGNRSHVDAACTAAAEAWQSTLLRLLRDVLPQREWTTDSLVEDVLA